MSVTRKNVGERPGEPRFRGLGFRRRTLACGFYRGYDVTCADRRARARWRNVIKASVRVLFIPTVFTPQLLKQLNVILITLAADQEDRVRDQGQSAYRCGGS
jgi:hypothetical protein